MSGRVSYKSKYLETKEKLEAKDEELKVKNKEIEDLKGKATSLESKVKELEEQLSTSDKEAEEYLDHLRRMKADFENYKKRMLKERQKIVNWAIEDLIKEFLPVVDDMERALDSSRESEQISSLLEGVEMVYNQFKELLKKKGVEQIPAEGEEFNPEVHEAIQRIESNEHPDNIIVEEMRKGYRIEDKVLRPSLVKVNKRQPSSREGEQKETEGGM